MTENTYTPEQKAAYKAMRKVEREYEHTGRTLESLTQIAMGMKATGDVEGIKLLVPAVKHTLDRRKALKPALHQARAAYYALFTNEVPADGTLSDDEAAAFDALAASLDD